MTESSAKWRLVCATAVSGALVGAVLLAPHSPARESAISVRQAYDTQVEQDALARDADQHPTGDAFMEAMRPGGDTEGHNHDHNDVATKNAVSRGDLSDPLAQDITADADAIAASASVAIDRGADQPLLVAGFTTRPRLAVPQDRYAMAGGCYSLQAPSGRFVHRAGRKPTVVGAGVEPIRFQATRLGGYLLYGTKSDYLGVTSLLDLLLHAPGFVAVAGTNTDWTVHAKGSGYTFVLSSGRSLVAKPDGSIALGTADKATAFKLHTIDGCATFPEIETNVGQPFKGSTSMQETRGLLDAHSHGMTHEFLGGQVLCGKPWHPYGVTKALVDCPDHTLTAGYGALLETFLSGGKPGHDTTGWPTFRDWPAPHSLTHQALYYKWLERSWRGGLRVFTSLLTENNVLCELYPLKKNSCNDMDAIRLQAKDMRQLEDYVDAQYGGPGRGWYRIVKDPFEARRVVNEGKLAVIMGIETSVPFDCNIGARAPKCTKESIDRSLDEVHRLGVRQMEITNKFDNGLTGVAGDAGSTGVLTNLANFLNTGSWLRMAPCPASFGAGVQDQQQVTVPGVLPEQDALFGAIAKLFAPLGALAPVYTSQPHCNQAGLTELGRHLIIRLVEKGMLFDPDHMSVLARRQALDLLEQLAQEGKRPGVLSSHSWSTPDALPRIYALGGVITPYAGDSKGFLEKWKKHLEWRDERYYFGFGFGADINGFGAQGDARKPAEANDVDYPFSAVGGVLVDRERGGQRVWDINTDGVAHYGLYPDWVEDVRVLAAADGEDFMADMSRGAEAYLQTWERASGVTNDGCRDPRALRELGAFDDVAAGMSVTAVLQSVGQPHTRIGTTYTYCAQRPGDEVLAAVTVSFTAAGEVVRVEAS
ncbi:hypothetical protein ASD81_16175 [Nocardioides sp. Root614]|nr:hypothetical protein ASD81_16175 [Nocardioides sp. Root614]KRA87653.1 hypothetical protein ASD84_16450 [Nocardioides sp. Root682]